MGRGVCPWEASIVNDVPNGITRSTADPTGLTLLLHDQDYKAWCHGGHGTSCSSCANIVLTAHASPRLATAASTRGCGRLTSHSAGDQKKLSQRLPSVWGRWEAGWDYYHYRFTGISAPRSLTCLSQQLEFGEVVDILFSQRSIFWCARVLSELELE